MADHLYFAWFLLDGEPWVEHECLNGEVETWHPPDPPWRLNHQGGITPSFDCERCGRHTILGPADRCDVPEGFHRSPTKRAADRAVHDDATRHSGSRDAREPASG